MTPAAENTINKGLAGLWKRSVPRGSFLESVLILMSGTAVAQFVPFLISPLLTRLYTPEEFGLFAEYFAIATILAVVSTARFELAVMLPKDDKDSVNLVALAIFLSLGTSAVVLLAAILFSNKWASMLGVPEIAPWLYMVPLFMFPTGVYQVLNYWSNRRQAYTRLAVNDVALKVASEGSKWCFGLDAFRRFVGNGLIVGTVVGQTLAAAIMTWRVWREDAQSVAHFRPKNMVSDFVKYKRFPMFNLPYSMLGMLGNEFMIFALTAFGHVHVAGFLSLTRRIVLAPITLLSTALGRVFFRETAVSIGTPRFESLTLKLMLTIVELFTPGFVLLGLWAPTVFAWVFGQEWSQAGQYASILVPVAFCSLFTTWPERVFEVSGMQHVSLTIELVSDVVRIVLVWALLRQSVQPMIVVITYSAISCLYHATYLIGIFAVAGLAYGGLYMIVKKILIVGAVSLSVVFLINICLPTPTSQLIAGVSVAALYTARLIQRLIGSDRMSNEAY